MENIECNSCRHVMRIGLEIRPGLLLLACKKPDNGMPVGPIYTGEGPCPKWENAGEAHAGPEVEAL